MLHTQTAASHLSYKQCAYNECSLFSTDQNQSYPYFIFIFLFLFINLFIYLFIYLLNSYTIFFLFRKTFMQKNLIRNKIKKPNRRYTVARDYRPFFVKLKCRQKLVIFRNKPKHGHCTQNNYMEGSGECHNEITQPIPSIQRKRKPLQTETT